MSGDMADDAHPAETEDLAAALHAARARLAAPGLPPEARARLRRQFIAICDAAKAPGASPAAVRRRLDGFIATLEIVIAENSGYKTENPKFS